MTNQIFISISQSSGSAVAAATLLNGNSERSSMLHGNSQKSMNGLSADEKEDIDNVICNNNNNAGEYCSVYFTFIILT